ncbi:MAG: AEC family transporter [Selenomonas sp.]|nr:AEC family transporter [Selenomonas sp.]
MFRGRNDGDVCAFILYNETGFAYAQLIGTCQNIMLVLLVFPMAQYFYLKQNRLPIRQGSRLHSFTKMFFSWNQLSLLGMVLGLSLQGLGVERPAELAPFFQSLVHIGAWTAMLPVGFLMDFGRAKHYLKYTLDLCAIRFFLVPAFVFFSSRLVFQDPVLLNTFVILATTPTAINAVLASKLYQLRTDLAVCSFILTTFLYLVVVFPLLFFLLK